MSKKKSTRIPPIHSYTMDLTTLTDQEEKVLLEVLEKDAVFSGVVDGKLSDLRKEIQQIRLQGVLVPGDTQHKICARCKYKFWSWICPFADHGKQCINCRFKVCKKCRILQANRTWICSLCIKQRHERSLTGEWFHKGQCVGLVGSDLLRASMRDRGQLTVYPIKSSEPEPVSHSSPKVDGVRQVLAPPNNSLEVPATYRRVRPRPETDGSDDTASTFSSESVRDSDSGVPSSRPSRANTPEQRGPQPKAQQRNDRPSVPSISVTASAANEYRDEEEDDIDDLFNHHRPSTLGSRSSLADSRESIYSVYSDAGEVNYGRIPVTGDIQFHLVYNSKAGQLEVHIKQCKDLAPVDTKHQRSDPYVKTYLLPDRTRGSKRKTKIKKHTLNPTFDEVLKYTISKTELESRQLWVTVWHNDRFGRNDFLGEVMLPLDYYRYDGSPRWYQLQERMEDPEDTSLLSYKGDLYISVKFVTPDMVEGTATKKKSGSFRRKSKEKEKAKSGGGEVHVLVREAKNLTAMRGASGASNPFCKGYLLPDDSHSSKQKTPVLKKTVNPQWSHILVFDGVDQKQLQYHGVELTIWDYEKLSSNDFLGGIRLNLGDGTFHGKPVDWMDARGEEIEVWRSMIAHPNEWVDAQLPLRSSMGASSVKNK